MAKSPNWASTAFWGSILFGVMAILCVQLAMLAEKLSKSTFNPRIRTSFIRATEDCAVFCRKFYKGWENDSRIVLRRHTLEKHSAGHFDVNDNDRFDFGWPLIHIAFRRGNRSWFGVWSRRRTKAPVISSLEWIQPENIAVLQSHRGSDGYGCAIILLPRFYHWQQRIIARNAYQILCPDLKTSSQFVVCWTPDGCIDQAGRSRQTVGTVQAIAIAASNGIEVIKLRRPDHLKFVMAIMNGQDSIPVIAKNFPRL